MPWPSLRVVLLLWMLPGVMAPALAQPATVLYRFQGRADGANPAGPLVADRSGILYGVTEAGGLGYGVIFALAPPLTADGAWTESVLYTFKNEADGVAPVGGLARDPAGNLYGATASGGVFRLAPPASRSGRWTFSLLYAFGTTAALPNTVALDAAGNLYGSTYYGGTDEYGPGSVYRLSPAPGGTVPWSFTLLHAFTGYPQDGAYPAGALTIDEAGVVYGTTTEGGSGRCFNAGTFIGCGTVFAIAPSGSTWTETPIYDFTVNDHAPYAGLTHGRGGTLYGTDGYDVFRLSPSTGGPWNKRRLYQFTEGLSGTTPGGTLLLGAGPVLYGTSTSSGLSGYTTAFRLAPPHEPGPWLETTLATFGSGLSGVQPSGGLVEGRGNGLYGVTSSTTGTDFGTIFRVEP